MTTPPTPPAPATDEPVPTAEVAVQHRVTFTLTFTEGGRITGRLADLLVETAHDRCLSMLRSAFERADRWSIASTYGRAS